MEKQIENFDREEFSDVLGLACESANVLFKHFKWFFHEINRTNVRIIGVASKDEDPSIQIQINNLMDSLNTMANTVAEETINLKENLEGRILSLKDKSDKMWNVVMKSGDASKVLAILESSKVIPLVIYAKKRKDIVSIDGSTTRGKVDVDCAGEKGVVKGNVLSGEIKTSGPGIRTRNRMKSQAEALGIDVSDTMDNVQKLDAIEMESVDILNNM